jgi:hypothetical protein
MAGWSMQQGSLKQIQSAQELAYPTYFCPSTASRLPGREQVGEP